MTEEGNDKENVGMDCGKSIRFSSWTVEGVYLGANCRLF